MCSETQARLTQEATTSKLTKIKLVCWVWACPLQPYACCVCVCVTSAALIGESKEFHHHRHIVLYWRDLSEIIAIFSWTVFSFFLLFVFCFFLLLLEISVAPLYCGRNGVDTVCRHQDGKCTCLYLLKAFSEINFFYLCCLHSILRWCNRKSRVSLNRAQPRSLVCFVNKCYNFFSCFVLNRNLVQPCTVVYIARRKIQCKFDQFCCG